MRRSALILALLMAPCSLLPAAVPSDFLPPAPPWQGASEALMARPDNPWITPAEKMGLLDTPNYTDTVAYLEKLVTASPLLKLHVFGRSAQGRALHVVIASKEGIAVPAALAANGRPTVLAQAGIHAGEIDGKDAGLMLLRDIAIGGKAALLDQVNFLFVPIFNADGHERISEWNRPNQRGPVHQGWRTTAQNLNLNRDYVKADAPEMHAMLGLLKAAAPALYLDLHVTDGIDYQYDITYGFNGDGGNFAWSPQSGSWLDQTLRPAVDQALKAHGHIPGQLVFGLNNRDLMEGVSNSSHGNPRFSANYGDLRHIPSILVENHSLKPYRQRVLGTYVLLEAALQTVGAHAAGLKAAIATDTAARPATIPMNWGEGRALPGEARKADFLGIDYTDYVSPASGVKEVRWLGTPKVFKDLPRRDDPPGVVLRRPRGYYVPVTKSDVIARLQLHGIQMETLTASRTVNVELYRLTDVQAASAPFESHFTLTAGVKNETHRETFPAGSVHISTDQPLGDLAVVMLEPTSRDSLFAWGFFNELLQRTEYIEGYALAPLAENMLREDPKLQAEFEARLVADPKFAADPTARLQWFYERSKFYDERYLLYPVGIER